jgi:hypothetical protein
LLTAAVMLLSSAYELSQQKPSVTTIARHVAARRSKVYLVTVKELFVADRQSNRATGARS